MTNFLHSLVFMVLFNWISSSSVVPCTIIGKCDEGKNAKDVCIAYTPENANGVSFYHVAPCSGDQTCSVNVLDQQANAKCVSKKSKRLYLDQEECFGDSTCYSHRCSKDVCVGIEREKPCNVTEQCAIGFFCMKNKCVDLYPVGSLCTKDNECVVNAGCYLLTGRCLQYFSLKSGQITTMAQFCESGYADYFGRNIVCAEKNLTENKCDSTGQCTFLKSAHGYPSIFAKEDCKCSLNYSEKTFCPLGSSNASYIEAIKIMNHTRGDVHTVRRLKPKSLSDQAIVLKALSYPKFVDVDYCVLDLYLASSYIKASLVALLLLVVI